MRILIVNKFWHAVGGVEKYCFLVSEFLERRGHHVVPFAMAHPDNEPAETSTDFPSFVSFHGEEQVAAARRAVIGNDARQALARLLDKHPCDAALVVHPYHQLGTSLFAELESRGVPIVLSVHDYKLCCPRYRLFSDRTGTICTRCLEHPILKTVAPAYERCWNSSVARGAVLGLEVLTAQARRAYQRADIVLVLNNLQRRCVEAAGIEPDRVRLLPHFVDLDSSADSGTPRETSSVLYVGRLSNEKGIDVLLEATEGLGVTLRIAGTGPMERLLGSVARRRPDVEMLGLLDATAVRTEMGRAGMLAVPSVWHEVSPFVIYEAFGMRLPVIGSDAGGIPDLLAHNRGKLVPVGDAHALRRAIADWVREPRAAAESAESAWEHGRQVLTRENFEDGLVAAFEGAGVRI